MSYAVVARYVCAPEDAEQVRAALLVMRAHTVREPANLTYVVHEEIGAEGTFVLYEQYTDEAGFHAHTAAPHFAEHIVGTVRPLLTERTVHFATVL